MAELEALKKEYQEILEQLGSPELLSDWERFEELTKKKKSLEKILEKEQELKETKRKVEENKAIISGDEDLDLVSLAEGEISQLKEREGKLEKELAELLSSKDRPEQPGAVIVEIRAGTGGEEAALFAANLFRMYSKYSQSQGWRQKVLDSRPSELGGYKEIVFELAGQAVFLKMRQEAGVHRIQRIPETEKSGRVHTSTASVAILSKPKKTQIQISPQDIKVDTFRASGPGGQYVNKRETAIRITHLPTGLVVTSQTERNQLQNKENALSVLAAKLLERKETEEADKIGGKRKSQIGGAKRAEKIRTYNFPQDRVTDHRTKKNFHNIEGIMDGKLEPIISTLTQSF